jgi:hypothetical protein
MAHGATQKVSYFVGRLTSAEALDEASGLSEFDHGRHTLLKSKHFVGCAGVAAVRIPSDGAD